MYRRDFLAPLHGKLESLPANASAASSRNLAHGKRHIRVRHHFAHALVHVPIRIEALGGFAHNYQVHSGCLVRNELSTTGRTHIRV